MVGADFEDVGLEFEGVVGTDVVISNVILEGRCRLKTTTSMFKTNRKNQVSSSMMPFPFDVFFAISSFSRVSLIEQ